MPMVHFHPANHITFMGLNITLHLNARLQTAESIGERHTGKTTTLRVKLNKEEKNNNNLYVYNGTTYALNVLHLRSTYT